MIAQREQLKDHEAVRSEADLGDAPSPACRISLRPSHVVSDVAQYVYTKLGMRKKSDAALCCGVLRLVIR